MSDIVDICPCETTTFPLVISNPSGRGTIRYRVGDYVSFREALLSSRSGEVELANWRPGAQGDLAVQMVEWWAYIADILTFYNEQSANQSYLRTANLPDKVQGLIRILGYRPRPGIGATGTLAALMSGTVPFTLPQGFQIQSKPGPGKQPQIFELMANTLVQPPDSTGADPVAAPALLGSGGLSVLLQGTVSSIKVGASLLLVEKEWAGTDTNYAQAVVGSTTFEKDPRNATNTLVSFSSISRNLSSAHAADYNLLRSQQSARLWQSGGLSYTLVQGTGTVHLDSVARQIQVGDPILFANSGGKGVLALVTSYSEAIFYIQPNLTGDPSQAPAAPAAGIPVLHSVIGFKVADASFDWTTDNRQTLSVRYQWQPAGSLITFPASTLTATQVSLQAPVPAALLPMVDQDVLISDANGNGVTAQATASAANPSSLNLSNFNDPAAKLAAPLNVLFDLLPVSRGKTVANEILGSGDATITTGQEFVLKNSPLTYLQSAGSASGTDYSSTLRVWVNDVQWTEVPSFYGQPPSARIFVTREDDQNVTHVQFGDGVNGARLPSGNNNVIATYRYGSGADAPAAGSLSVILKSWPGLRSIANPVTVGGGSDPDAPQKIKTLAPASVLTFGRAISADDYETIAAQAPGVARARSYWTWDSVQQRMMVKVYVGDDANAVSSANTALAGASDPNRPLKVYAASVLPISVGFTLLVNAAYVPDDVKSAVTAALIDADLGLLGMNVVQIGESIWQSQIYQACLNVAGVVAVHDLRLERKLVPAAFTLEPFLRVNMSRLQSGKELFRPVTKCRCQDFRADPGEGGFFRLSVSDLNISTVVATNGN